MAAPTYVAAGTLAAATNSGTRTPGLPSGWQQNDIFIMLVYRFLSDTLTVPSGWAHVTGSPGSFTGGSGAAVLWKRATASESAPNVSTVHAARIFAIRGCRTSGDPWDASAFQADSDNDTTLTYPSVTTTDVDRLVLLARVCAGGVTSSGYSNANLTSITERTDDSTGFSTSLGMTTGVKTAAGSTGTTSATTSGAASDGMFTIAMAATESNPASGSFACTLPMLSTTSSGEVHNDATVAATLPAASAAFAAEHYNEGEGAVTTVLPKLSSALAGSAATGGTVDAALPMVSATFTAGTVPAGPVDIGLPMLTFESIGETRVFGSNVILVEAEKRAFRVTQDDMIPIYASETYTQDVGVGQAGVALVQADAFDAQKGPLGPDISNVSTEAFGATIAIGMSTEAAEVSVTNG